MSKLVHYPNDDTKYPESMWRKAICHGNRSAIDIVFKGTPHDPIEALAYYSRDESQITCKMCKKKLAKNKINNATWNLRAKLARLKTRRERLDNQISELEKKLRT